jgi:microsomal dipeptidase-like Zn-dependent dipeptidase
MSASVKMNLAQMQEAAKTGAFLEMVYLPTITSAAAKRQALFSIADVANNIRKIGPEFVILSTDMGQIGLPPPPDGMSAYIAELKAQGISQRDLDEQRESGAFAWAALEVANARRQIRS